MDAEEAPPLHKLRLCGRTPRAHHPSHWLCQRWLAVLLLNIGLNAIHELVIREISAVSAVALLTMCCLDDWQVKYFDGMAAKVSVGVDLQADLGRQA